MGIKSFLLTCCKSVGVTEATGVVVEAFSILRARGELALIFDVVAVWPRSRPRLLLAAMEAPSCRLCFIFYASLSRI